ncbi:MAG: hypothetical protein FWC00_00785 [Firmicutes bacterium]|nr:hypothetical protein [Bacillota bacterium]
MFKIPHENNTSVVIDDISVAPVIAGAIGVPFAYVASHPENMEHARTVFENMGLELGTTVTVTSADNLETQIPIIPPPVLYKGSQRIALKDMVATLTEFGYQKVVRIEHEGEWQLRGDILDVFSDGILFRIMFLGDEIEQIKTIDPGGFTTIDTLKSCTIAPIPDRYIATEHTSVLESLKHRYPIIVLEQETKLAIWVNLKEPFEPVVSLKIRTAPVANYFSAISVLVPELVWNIKSRNKTVVCYVGKSKALERYLEQKAITYKITTYDNIHHGAINIVQKPLGASFELVDQGIVVYSIGTAPPQPQTIHNENCATTEGLDYCDCEFEIPQEGSLVIHQKHGLGRYIGKKRMEFGSEKKEYLILQYDGGTFVYVPTDQLGLLYNYIGSPRRLDRI